MKGESNDRRGKHQTVPPSESYLRAVLDNVLDGIISIDEDGIVQTFNPAAERIFGYAAAEVIGQNVKVLMPEPYRTGHDGYVQNYLRTGRAKIMGIGREVEGVRKNGEIFPLYIAVSEMRLGEGRIFVGIVQDRTETRKAAHELQETERKLTTLMANLPGMAYRCLNDPDWTFKFASEGCRELTGYDPDDFIDNKRLSFNAIIHPDDRGAVWEEVQTALEKRRSFLVHYRIQSRSGEEKWIREQGVGIFSDQGDLVAIEGLMVDVTERIRAEEALRRLNEELEQRIGERTEELQLTNLALKKSLADLKGAQDQLVQSEKMAALGELVSGVAHEINTPVGICVTAASWLQLKLDALSERLDHGGLDTNALQPFLGAMNEANTSITTNLDRAAELVKSFKQVAVDQATEEKRRFNLKAYIDMILLSLRPKYKRTGHTLEVHCPEALEIVSYPGALSQIVTNLVMNSLMHGFDGVDQGRITLSVSVADDCVVFHYRDDGRGMSAETLKKIYDPFFTTQRSQGGSGLGMHIVYNLVVRRLDGWIDCESAPGKGAAFTITFPYEAHAKESVDGTQL